MRRCLWITLAVLTACATGFGQELLVNPSFAIPSRADCGWDDIPNPVDPNVQDWRDSTGNLHRNDGYGGPPCPADFAYMGFSGQQFSRWVYQTVTVDSAAATYVLCGKWGNTCTDTAPFRKATFVVEVRSGTDVTPPGQPDGLPASILYQSNGNPARVIEGPVAGSFVHNYWTPFSFSIAKPDGITQMTVVLRCATDAYGVAMHVDDMSLVASDATLTSIDSVDTPFGVRGTNPFSLQLTGSGFIQGTTTVKLFNGPGPDITAPAGSVQVNGGTLTASLDLSTAVLGQYSVQVSNGSDCSSASVVNGFRVILPAVPGLTNTSFELETLPGGCPTPTAGQPTDWLAWASVDWKWQNRLNRDGWIENTTLTPLPSCPPPDGEHYATIATDTTGSAYAYQTLAVTNGTQYVFSGSFAGTGNSKLTLELRDGGPDGTLLSSYAVADNAGSFFDWTPGVVSATATSDVMSVLWRVESYGGGQTAAHADALVLEVCTTPITVTGMSPQEVDNTLTDPQTVYVNGSGFAGTPEVTLIRQGGTIPATVTNVTADQITVTANMYGVPSGRYGVMVKQGGCMATLSPTDPGAILVIGDFVNGSFEAGDPGNKADMPGWGLLVERPGATIEKTQSGANGAVFGGIDTAWDGQFYAGQAVGSGDAFHVALYQVFRTVPGTDYSVSGGYFGGIGPPGDDPVTLGLAWWEVLVVDGSNVSIADMNGTGGTPTQIAKKEHLAGEAGMSFRETFTADFTALSEATTIFLKWGYVPGDYATHLAGWDNLAVTSTCVDPFADTDGDGDVDQTDFAVFQLCYTGANQTPVPTTPEYCKCLDVDGIDNQPDDDIDQGDYNKFDACASGPGIPADPSCDD